MTSSLRRAWATAVALTALAALAPAPGAAVPYDGGVLASRAASSGNPTTQVQRVRVDWKGTQRSPDYVDTAVIPGIGSLDLVCKPHDTRIRLETDHRDRETQMWLQKYERKGGEPVVSVKNARIYRFAHADDDGSGGTGNLTQEGLNQEPGVEDVAQNRYLYGVISARPGRDRPGGPMAVPVTTFELDWNWRGFDKARPERRSCTIEAVFTTQFPPSSRIGLAWRGLDGVAAEQQTTQIPGIGTLTLSCPRERAVEPTLRLEPTSADSSLYVEDVQGEGQVRYQRTQHTLPHDPGTGALGPYPLPSNGSLRLQVASGDVVRWLLVSSVWKRNDPRESRNLCEVAAGYYDR